MKGFQKLDAYKKAYPLAMEIFHLSKSFPKHEVYSLTDQIRRSSRSVCANFAEAYRQRIYKANFVRILTICDGECSETIVWLRFALDCEYITNDQFAKLSKGFNEVGELLGTMIRNPEKFMDGNQNTVGGRR